MNEHTVLALEMTQETVKARASIRVEHGLISDSGFSTTSLLLLRRLYLAGHIKVSDYRHLCRESVAVVGIFIARTKLGMNDLRGVSSVT